MPDIIDIAILGGNRVVEKEKEKVKKYQELRRDRYLGCGVKELPRASTEDYSTTLNFGVFRLVEIDHVM